VSGSAVPNEGLSPVVCEGNVRGSWRALLSALTRGLTSFPPHQIRTLPDWDVDEVVSEYIRIRCATSLSLSLSVSTLSSSYIVSRLNILPSYSTA
jgi:hypothetical protein